MDIHVLQHLGPQVKWYPRYVDDSFIVGTEQTIKQVQRMQSNWMQAIKWEIQNSSMTSTCVPFLDVSLSFSRLASGDLQVEHQTYIKPLNQHLYLPRTSCHPTGVFSGLVQGEISRLRRTCKHEKDLQQHLFSFVSKLRARGYGNKEINIWQSKALQRNCFNKVNKLFMITVWSASLNSKVIQKAFHQHRHLLTSKPSVSFRVQTNNFYKRYRSWRNLQLGRVRRE